jgi:hypothetical protein
MARRGNQVCAEQRAFFHDTAAFPSTRTMQHAAFAVAPVGDRSKSALRHPAGRLGEATGKGNGGPFPAGPEGDDFYAL